MEKGTKVACLPATIYVTGALGIGRTAVGHDLVGVEEVGQWVINRVKKVKRGV